MTISFSLSKIESLLTASVHARCLIYLPLLPHHWWYPCGRYLATSPEATFCFYSFLRCRLLTLSLSSAWICWNGYFFEIDRLPPVFSFLLCIVKKRKEDKVAKEHKEVGRKLKKLCMDDKEEIYRNYGRRLKYFLDCENYRVDKQSLGLFDSYCIVVIWNLQISQIFWQRFTDFICMGVAT